MHKQSQTAHDLCRTDFFSITSEQNSQHSVAYAEILHVYLLETTLEVEVTFKIAFSLTEIITQNTNEQ